MKKKITIWITLLLVTTLSACSLNADQTQQTAVDVEPLSTATVSLAETDSTDAQVELASTAAVDYSAVENILSDTHDEAEDYAWDVSTETLVLLEDGSSTPIDGSGLVEGNLITISTPGNYRIKGTLSDGGVVVDVAAKGVVRLILDGVDITNSIGAAITITNADKVILVLADDSINLVADGQRSSTVSLTEDEPNAAIFSTTDLTIFGNGSLVVNGNFEDGITSKDGLVIAGGNLQISAVDDGIRGKDYLAVKGGSFKITAGGDALKADNEDETNPGYLILLDGSYNLNALGDGITAQGPVTISSGVYAIATGGGSGKTVSGDSSAKGIKSSSTITIHGGVFNLDSSDDTLNANGSILIDGGSVVLASGDDAIHADTSLVINDGEILVTKSYEGLESLSIEINGGNIHLNTADDGINVSDGSGGGEMAGGMAAPANGMDGMRPEGGIKPDRGNQPLGGPGLQQEGFLPSNDMAGASPASGQGSLTITNGTIVVNANGDGLDINGSIIMSDGLLIINGPTANMNGAIDYDGSFNITGGTLIAVGSSGMAQAPGSASIQNSILVNFDSPQEAGTLIHIQDESGNNVLTFQTGKSFQSLAFSSPELVNGAGYILSLGGSAGGSMSDNLYQDGSVSGESVFYNFTVTEPVTYLGSIGRNR